MTAEIVIMNKEAVAIAADSAVTMTVRGDKKIVTSANKIFALSHNHPIGIMFFNSAQFMGIPWETIIKIYRVNIQQQKLDTLEDYCQHFLAFLAQNNPIFPEELQNSYLQRLILDYFQTIVSAIQKDVNSYISQRGSINDQETKGIVSSVVARVNAATSKVESKGSISVKQSHEIIHSNSQMISTIIETVFQRLPLSKSCFKQLDTIAVNMLAKLTNKRSNSGLVIVGFGERDVFPSFKSFTLDGIFQNQLKYIVQAVGAINHGRLSNIVPFAQGEMVARFMNGVDPLYRTTEQSYLHEMYAQYARKIADTIPEFSDDSRQKLKEQLLSIGKDLAEDFKKKTDSYILEQYVKPITSLVSFLPKNELAAMAESLVNLTAIKRRFSMEEETVAEPIDVAVISKGDGFIWIKRKHYFQAELNPQFFSRY